MAQVDIPTLLSRLGESVARNAGIPEAEIAARRAYTLRMMMGIMGGSAYARSALESGGDYMALATGFVKELEANGAPRDKIKLVQEYCSKLTAAGGRPGLSAHAATALLVLLRRLNGSVGARAPPPVSLSKAVQLGGLPAVYPALPQSRPGSRQSLASTSRPMSAVSYAGSLQPGQHAVRPTSVLTPSELGEDPSQLLSAEMSRASLLNSTTGDLISDFYFARGAGGPGRPEPAAIPATSEPSLVRDVLYAAQGVSGRALGWVEAGGDDVASGFRPDQARAAGLGAARTMLLERLTELGWLFRHVRRHVEDSSAEEGAVRQALGAALADELGDFFRLLALLEAQAALPLPTPGDSAAAEDQYLTLRRLLCWLAEPTRRMRLLATVADAGEGLGGGALAGAVYEFSRHGDPFVAANAAKLLQQVCVPLYGMIRRWVLEGNLEDPHGEFFIVQHAAATAVNAALREAVGAAGGGGGAAAAALAPPMLDLWRQSYGLDETRLPPFIVASLAQRILRAGKAIHYLKQACGDAGWVQQRAEEWARSPPAAAYAAGSGELASLDALVSEAVRSVDARLLDVIWRRHRLRAHFAAVRRFLLLGQGDWVTAFMDLAQRELDKAAGDVSEVQLNSCLRQAFTATNVMGGSSGAVGGGAGRGALAALAGVGGSGVGDEDGEDDSAVVTALAEKLRIKKERAAGAGEVGWDVFSLTYNPAAGLPAAMLGGSAGGPQPTPAPTSGGPLSALFTAQAMLSYGRLAKLLWRMKRSEHALSATWGAAACGLQRTVDKMGRDGALAQPVLAQLLRLRAEMSHFAINLQYYIQFEVMEACWQEFYARAAACADLDSLITAHEEHLAKLLRKALLEGGSGGGGGSGYGSEPGPNSAALRRALQDALTNMVALRAVAARLEEAVEGGARKLQTRNTAARQRVARGGWGVQAPAAGAGGDEPVIDTAALRDIRRTLTDLAAQHQRAVGEFTENLPEEAQDDVRFLLARLDFSAKGVQAGPAAGAAGGAGGAVALIGGVRG
ncbi:hypothetical protein HYH02_008031 [Chlamydomonas schloesseri]|uniref:Gamma-tubulin complex component n=1 Tax=Chlamydomonas schloesseri TaxID=2026947 RepID=A0A835WG83_9CHLO|nr:hypothetical protein HYH02_008031 [Chlamydomonas schloesseri]|eukprot:KAG2446875.1 hypothetical protein HYH02_008031 [Chlamydomonas schloesseri]